MQGWQLATWVPGMWGVTPAPSHKSTRTVIGVRRRRRLGLPGSRRRFALGALLREGLAERLCTPEKAGAMCVCARV